MLGTRRRWIFGVFKAEDVTQSSASQSEGNVGETPEGSKPMDGDYKPSLREGERGLTSIPEFGPSTVLKLESNKDTSRANSCAHRVLKGNFNEWC